MLFLGNTIISYSQNTLGLCLFCLQWWSNSLKSILILPRKWNGCRCFCNKSPRRLYCSDIQKIKFQFPTSLSSFFYRNYFFKSILFIFQGKSKLLSRCPSFTELRNFKMKYQELAIFFVKKEISKWISYYVSQEFVFSLQLQIKGFSMCP